MKHFAYLYKIIGILISLLFLSIPVAYANTDIQVSDNGDNSQNSVHVETNTGGNTICQNGTCTTTSGGNGKATVCINGNCQTSDDGNIDMQSDDGHNQVNVENHTATTAVTEEPSDVTISPEPSINEKPSMTPDPTIKEMRKDIDEKVVKQTEAIKEHVKSQEAALSDFFKWIFSKFF